MTTTLDTHATTAPRITFPGMLRAELVRLKLHSVAWTALLAAVVLAASGPIGALFLTNGPTPNLAPEAALEQLAQGVLLAQLIVGALGATIAAGRYSTGEMRTILAATPRRGQTLAALTAVAGTVTFTLTALAGYAGYVVTRAILLIDGQPSLGLLDPTVLQVVLGMAGYLTAVTLVGLALGVLLRSTAAAIATVFLGFYLLPELATFLIPATWFDRIGDYLPSTAGTQIYALEANAEGLGPAVAATVLLAWTAAAIAAGATALARRDA